MAEAEELTATKKRTSSVVAVGDGAGASTPSVVLTKRGSNLAPLPQLADHDEERQTVVVDMYKGLGDGESEEEEEQKSVQEDPSIHKAQNNKPNDMQNTGDPITTINIHLWRPVLESYEFFHFEDTKRLHLLSKTTEFFQFIHKHLVDEAVIIDSKFPHVPEWKRRTSIWLDWKGKNNVTNITKALNDCHKALSRELAYIERSRIICTEDKIQTPIIRFQDMHLGEKTFRVGNYSVATPKNFFVGKRTFQSDDWKGALSKHHPGRTLMESVSMFEHGEQPEPDDPSFEEFKRLLMEAEEEKMHNLCISEYAASLKMDITSAHKRKPLRITWDNIYNYLMENSKNPPSDKILRSLKESFTNVEYIVNPHFQHLPSLDNSNSDVRILSSPIIWLDSFTKLLNERAKNLFALKNAIMEFLRGRRKKEKSLKGKTRICVEELQVEVDEESDRMKEVIQNLKIPFNAFNEFYQDDEDVKKK